MHWDERILNPILPPDEGPNEDHPKHEERYDIRRCVAALSITAQSQCGRQQANSSNSQRRPNEVECLEGLERKG